MALRPENILSLFAGAGGLDLALRLAHPEVRCVCYVEREIEAAEILAARMADKALDDAPVWSDVCTFDGRPWRGIVDGIVGGFPCQDLSVAGKREGIQRGNRSGLWYEYARIIREVQPRWVFIENVRAVLAFPAGGIVLGELAAMGFDAEWASLEACDVGASHERHRKFILAYRRGIDRRKSLRARIAQWSPAGNGGTPLVHAKSSGRDGARLARRGDGCEGTSGGSGGHVEQSARHGRGEGWTESAGKQGRSDVAVAGCEMGNADDERLEGWRLLADECANERIAWPAGDKLGFFAPGPAEFQWPELLVRYPWLRPALSPAEAQSDLRGMADGVASRLDRRVDSLRACGNGVVALQGAAAFAELVRRSGK